MVDSARTPTLKIAIPTSSAQTQSRFVFPQYSGGGGDRREREEEIYLIGFGPRRRGGPIPRVMGRAMGVFPVGRLEVQGEGEVKCPALCVCFYSSLLWLDKKDGVKNSKVNI